MSNYREKIVRGYVGVCNDCENDIDERKKDKDYFSTFITHIKYQLKNTSIDYLFSLDQLNELGNYYKSKNKKLYYKKEDYYYVVSLINFNGGELYE